MRRILVFDSDHPSRSALMDVLQRHAETDVVLAGSTEELEAKLKSDPFAAVFVDGDLLGENAPRLIAAVRSAPVRPMLIIASNDKAEDLDPDFVSLVVHKPYDVLTLTGILLAAVMETPRGRASAGESARAN